MPFKNIGFIGAGRVVKDNFRVTKRTRILILN